VCDFIAKRELAGRNFTIVVVAEGVKPPPELKENRRFSPVGNLIGNAIAAGSNKEVRVSVLGHIQRGGSPSPFDRVLATRFGVSAVELIARGDFGKMVALRASSIVGVDMALAIGQLKSVRPDGELVRTARAIGIGFGD
jgi:6-phosphofructokinase 1